MAVLLDQHGAIGQLDQSVEADDRQTKTAGRSPRPATGGSGRLVGIDLARAVALIGMFTQHVELFGADGGESTGWVAWFFEQSAGRASVLFFVLSGISLAMIHRRGSASAEPGALYRRGFLLLAGGILLTLTIWPASILQHYGVAFLLAPLLLRLSWRGLGAVTGAGLVGGPIFLLFAQSWTDDVASAWDGQSGRWLIESTWDTMVSGIYPMVLWIGFFTFGMLLGKLDFRDRRTTVRLLAASIIATAALGGVANLLVDRYGDANFAAEPASSDFSAEDSFTVPKFEEQPADWRALYDVTGHSGRIGWTLQTSAIAVAILCFALLLPGAVTKLLTPLAWMGSMSLTAYLVHIILVNDVFDTFVADAGWSILTKEFVFLGLVITLITICSLFYRLWKVGPLEWLLKKFTVGKRPEVAGQAAS